MASASPLHIVVDGRELVGRPTGVGRYLLSVLSEWARPSASPSHRITVIVPGDVPPELRALSPRIGIEHVAGAAAIGTWFEQTRLPRVVRRLGADVFFAPAYTAPLTLGCPFAVVIHDLSYFVHPEWFRWREGLRRRWVTRETAKRAAAIITVSEQSAAELATWLGIGRPRVLLAPPGPPPSSASPAVPAAARERMVLYVGSIFARRGVPALIDAFADVARTMPDARLVLVGDNRSTPPIDPTALATAAGIADRVNWRRYAPDAELQSLYQRARVFAFLSDYEGFAMTPMEAIAQGVPAVLRDTPIAREVYGDGVVRVGGDRDALVSALTTLLADDHAHAAALARGQARLASFSWATSAATIMRALERAAGRA